MEKITCMVFFLSSMLYFATASDPPPLQDFCIGETNPHAGVFVNGYFCKNPADVTANDFLYRGFDTVGDTNNPIGVQVVMVNSSVFPALNTMGVILARIDYAVGGANVPHLHPLASEMLTVLEGTLYAGFVTSNLESGGNKLYATVLKKGDIFVFPQGLIHFQLNIGKTPAVANAAFGSQNPGLVTLDNAVFGSSPAIFEDVLTKGFQVDKKVIDALRSSYQDPFYSSFYNHFTDNSI